MTFWQKFKNSILHFMAGRNGADQLSISCLWMGLICYLTGAIIASVRISILFPLIGMLLNLLGFAAYVYCIFRMFSRNIEKRRAENWQYISARDKRKTKRRQAKMRFQNRKKYKYFKCPGCKSWLRLSRGKGVVTITCSRCQTSFTQKS